MGEFSSVQLVDGWGQDGGVQFSSVQSLDQLGRGSTRRTLRREQKERREEG